MFEEEFTYELKLLTSSIAIVRNSVGIPYLKHIAFIFMMASFLSKEPNDVLLPPVVKTGVTICMTFFATFPFGFFFAFNKSFLNLSLLTN